MPRGLYRYGSSLTRPVTIPLRNRRYDRVVLHAWSWHFCYLLCAFYMEEKYVF